MARGVNKVILIGNLGKDPEVRYMPSGAAAASVTIATSESWKDKQTGEKKERTEWHNVEFFNRLAEIAAEYLKKGSKVYIEGSLRTDKYQDKTTGADRYITKIVASEMQILDSRGGDGDFSQAEAKQGGGRAAKPESQAAGGGGFDDFESEIPF